jgi:hypothetical protein
MTDVESTAPGSRETRAKVRSFRFFENIWLIGDTGDPETTGLLIIFATLVALALVAADVLLPHDRNAYSHVLQTAAGVVVLVGVYYTAANLRTAREEQYAARLATTIGQLGSETVAVRIGAIRLLEAMAWETPNVPTDARERVVARKKAILDVLTTVASEQSSPAADVLPTSIDLNGPCGCLVTARLLLGSLSRTRSRCDRRRRTGSSNRRSQK